MGRGDLGVLGDTLGRKEKDGMPGRHISVGRAIEGVSEAGVECRKEDLETMSERSLEARMYGLSCRL